MHGTQLLASQHYFIKRSHFAGLKMKWLLQIQRTQVDGLLPYVTLGVIYSNHRIPPAARTIL
jgi:hypothetical protein